LRDEALARLGGQLETPESPARMQALGVGAVSHSPGQANARDQHIGQRRWAESCDVELRLRADRFAHRLIHVPVLEHGLCNGRMPRLDQRGIQGSLRDRRSLLRGLHEDVEASDSVQQTRRKGAWKRGRASLGDRVGEMSDRDAFAPQRIELRDDGPQ